MAPDAADAGDPTHAAETTPERATAPDGDLDAVDALGVAGSPPLDDVGTLATDLDDNNDPVWLRALEEAIGEPETAQQAEQPGGAS